MNRIIWLASFPKSGNTWVRALLAHYFFPKGEAPGINELRRFTTGDVRQDFFDRAAGGSYQGDSFDDWLITRSKVLRLIAASRQGTHFVKTHCRVQRIGSYDVVPPELTAAAVYLMRNPFDVAPSYARHLDVTIDDVIDKMLNPKALNATPTLIFETIGRWDDHVASWLDAPGLPRHLVRYEDLIDNTERTIRSLLGFLQAPISDGKLRRAIRATTFKELQKQEANQGFVERPTQMDKFFRKGQAGGWREDLTPAQVARLHEGFLPALQRWYPEMVEETAAVAASA